MNIQLPNLDTMTTVEAIHWYTKQVSDVFSTKNRVAGTYTEAGKRAFARLQTEIEYKSLS
ncbi:hypothetical protein [Virgibacillus salexigens]|uniref:hypothetical protein n=1 Tax=Virgibacillus salexigens TaxID=61016 RepID=UPI00190C859D|nr:hypothetical protein [Virgibacillus salexigens]